MNSYKISQDASTFLRIFGDQSLTEIRIAAEKLAEVGNGVGAAEECFCQGDLSGCVQVLSELVNLSIDCQAAVNKLRSNAPEKAPCGNDGGCDDCVDKDNYLERTGKNIAVGSCGPDELDIAEITSDLPQSDDVEGEMAGGL